MFLQTRRPLWYLPCISQWLSSKACVQTGTYHRRDVCVLIVWLSSITQSMYLLVEQEGRCISAVPQTHKVPHTALIAAANGLVRVMAMIPAVAQSIKLKEKLYSRIQNFNFVVIANEPKIILRHWSCSCFLIMRNSHSQATTTQHYPPSGTKTGPSTSGKEPSWSKEVMHCEEGIPSAPILV